MVSSALQLLQSHLIFMEIIHSIQSYEFHPTARHGKFMSPFMEICCARYFILWRVFMMLKGNYAIHMQEVYYFILPTSLKWFAY